MPRALAPPWSVQIEAVEGCTRLCAFCGLAAIRSGPGEFKRMELGPNTQVPAPRRDQLERLIRYTARGAVALERLGDDAHGDRIDTCTRPWSDGTTGSTLSPLELLEKLAAVVPVPRVHLVRYAGCLTLLCPPAPCAAVARSGSLPPSPTRR